MSGCPLYSQYFIFSIWLYSYSSFFLQRAWTIFLNLKNHQKLRKLLFFSLYFSISDSLLSRNAHRFFFHGICLLVNPCVVFMSTYESPNITSSKIDGVERFRLSRHPTHSEYHGFPTQKDRLFISVTWFITDAICMTQT